MTAFCVSMDEMTKAARDAVRVWPELVMYFSKIQSCAVETPLFDRVTFNTDE